MPPVALQQMAPQQQPLAHPYLPYQAEENLRAPGALQGLTQSQQGEELQQPWGPPSQGVHQVVP